MPLLNRGQLKGVLYLEHSSEPDLFTPGRLQIIEALGTQMAVSLEIALIHENLEDLACRREAQLAEAQQAVESATKVKSAFLASMSHELRTPLNAIMGYSELLKDELEDEGMEDFTPDLEKIRWAGKHLVTLINDIMDLSNLEAGSMELLLQPFSVSNLLDEVRAAIMPLVERSGNALNIEVEQGLGEVLADQTRVKQIIFILLSNACKFTDQGSITLRMRQEQDCLLFSVSDTGIGITREQQALIYEPFKQADATTTKKHDGAGLGLALAKYLTEMMHGSIMVESEAGQGTTFEVRLPVLIDQQDARAEPDTAEGPPDEPKRAAAGTILVIDDDAAVRGIMQRMLTQDGFVVHCAEDGEQGLRMAR